MELEINEFVNSNQILKQKDLENSKEDLSKIFSKSNFDFDLVFILGKEHRPGFGSCPRRRKGKIELQCELHDVGRVVRSQCGKGLAWRLDRVA
jgi:protein-tyrosine-phosphatase